MPKAIHCPRIRCFGREILGSILSGILLGGRLLGGEVDSPQLQAGVGAGTVLSTPTAEAHFWPNDPYFDYKPEAPLHPGQWNLVNRAPREISFPENTAPNGHKTAAVTINPAGLDANLQKTWRAGFTGQGIVIGILDDGLCLDHPDLAVARELSADLDSKGVLKGGGAAQSEGDAHGTSVAGMAAAVGGNGKGVVGVAPHAQVASLRTKYFKTLEDWFVPACGYYWQAGLAWQDGMDSAALAGLNRIVEAPRIQVKNCSTRTAQFSYPAAFGDCYDAISRMSANGVIYTVAAGNCRGTWQQDVGLLDEPNHPYALNVAALSSAGKWALYSNYGASVLITTLSQSAFWNPLNLPGQKPYADGLGVATTDLPEAKGTNYDGNRSTVFLPDVVELEYTGQFDGTSAAAPTAAGIMALAKQANPNLGPRLAKQLLVHSCRIVDAGDRSASATWTAGGRTISGWQKNAAGFCFNPNYGFGLPDTDALVGNALRTLYVTQESIHTTGVLAVAAEQQEVAAGDAQGRSQSLKLEVPEALAQRLEAVEFYVRISGGLRQEWQIIAQKDDTSSRLWSPANEYPNGNIMFGDPNPAGGLDRFIAANAFWGEKPSGTYTLTVSNPTGKQSARWLSWGVILHMGEVVFEGGPLTLQQNVSALGLSLNRADSQVTLAPAAAVEVCGDVLVNAGELRVMGTLRPGAAVRAARFDPGLKQVAEDVAYQRGVLVELNGGILSGSGTVIATKGADARGAIRNSGGVVAPGTGTKPGVLTFGGEGEKTDYVQRLAGGLKLVVAANGESSRLRIHGAATLGGRLEVVTANPREIQAGQVIEDVIEADSLAGNFEALASAIPGHTPELAWHPWVSGNKLNLVAEPVKAKADAAK